MPRKGVFPGTFDPFTRGHNDIVRRSLKIFDEVIVAVLVNLDKETLFSVGERLDLIARELGDLGDRVKVASFSGLLVDFARQSGATAIIRGLRAISDYDYEAQMALMNRSLCEEIETIFLISREENSYISSSLVKQVATLGGAVTNLLSPLMEQAVKDKLKLK